MAVFMRCREGHYDAEHTPVTSHVSSIPERLKEADPRLFVMLNVITQKFEIHISGQRGTTFGCELPYPELDARAIPYVQERLDQDARKVYAEVTAKNKKLNQKKVDAGYDKADYKAKNALLWEDHHPSNPETPRELIAE